MNSINFRVLLIVIIISAAFFTTMGILVTQISNDYNLPQDGNFTVMFTEMNKTLTTNEKFAERFQNSTETSSGFSLLGGEGSIANVMSSTIKMPFAQIKTTVTMKDLIAVKLGIPTYILNMLFAILLIISALVFLTILFRTPGGI